MELWRCVEEELPTELYSCKDLGLTQQKKEGDRVWLLPQLVTHLKRNQ